ncbi:choline transporter [Bacillus sp. CPSM8]|uniref:glycine betaine uptake BCCT transporter n=1 Tax=Bacillus TaxID=1386 RepID=UPI0003A47855|nr:MULTISPECIES: BCCT family transporter [Bacillus]ETB72872.1 choline transporter [Bacillus sp. CPSM8]MCY1629164.1 BCCT family transporter [Bacillus paralicheniformis]
MKKVTSVFWISLFISVIFVIWGAWAPQNLALISSNIQSFLTDKFGWLYILSVSVFLIYSIYLIFSPYGRMKLGKPDDKPEYNRLTWFAMLFSAGMGIGIIFWGAAEPLVHFSAPPRAEPETVEAATKALRYSVFHWGLHTWGIYTIIALAIAYFKFRREVPGVISSTLQPLLGNKVNGVIGQLIDIIAVFATIFGVATSLGMGASQIGGGLAFITDIENTMTTKFIIIIIVTVLFMISAWTGISRGIKYLSNINIFLAVVLLLLTIIIGPTGYILEKLSSTTFSYLKHLPEDSFAVAPFDPEYKQWIKDWTVFYWAWFIAWSPFVGTFIARVSKGRTIREFVIGVLFIPTLFCILWFAVFGGGSLFQELEGINTGLTELANEEALFGMFSSLPFGTAASVLAVFVISTFFITSADSATFVLGMQSTNGSLNPPNMLKLVWGVIQAATASVLLASGGLGALQTASIVSAFPFIFILLMMIVSLNKAMKEDFHERNN